MGMRRSELVKMDISSCGMIHLFHGVPEDKSPFPYQPIKQKFTGSVKRLERPFGRDDY